MCSSDLLIDDIFTFTLVHRDGRAYHPERTKHKEGCPGHTEKGGLAYGPLNHATFLSRIRRNFVSCVSPLSDLFTHDAPKLFHISCVFTLYLGEFRRLDSPFINPYFLVPILVTCAVFDNLCHKCQVMYSRGIVRIHSFNSNHCDPRVRFHNSVTRSLLWNATSG